MKKYFKLLLAIILVSPLGYVYAANVVTPVTTITSVDFYNNYGNSDIMFKVANNGTDCVDGFWFNKDDPSYKELMSSLLTARVAKLQVRVNGDTSKIWTGSAGTFCRVNYISYTDI